MGIPGGTGNPSNLKEPLLSEVVGGAQFYRIFMDFQEWSGIAGSFKDSRKAIISLFLNIGS